MITRRSLLSLIPALAAATIVPATPEPACGCFFSDGGGVVCRKHGPRFTWIGSGALPEAVIPMTEDQVIAIVGRNILCNGSLRSVIRNA